MYPYAVSYNLLCHRVGHLYCTHILRWGDHISSWSWLCRYELVLWRITIIFCITRYRLNLFVFSTKHPFMLLLSFFNLDCHSCIFLLFPNLNCRFVRRVRLGQDRIGIQKVADVTFQYRHGCRGIRYLSSPEPVQVKSVMISTVCLAHEKVRRRNDKNSNTCKQQYMWKHDFR